MSQEHNNSSQSTSWQEFWTVRSHRQLYSHIRMSGRRMINEQSRLILLSNCLANKVIPPTLQSKIHHRPCYSQQTTQSWKEISLKASISLMELAIKEENDIFNKLKAQYLAYRNTLNCDSSLNENLLSIVNQCIDEVMKKYSKDKEQFRNRKFSWIKKKCKDENINLSDILDSDTQNGDLSLYLDADTVFNSSTLSMPNLSLVSAVDGPMNVADVSINTPSPSSSVTPTEPHNAEHISPLTLPL